MPRILDPFTQYFDDAGAPLASGWLRFTVSGTNNTDKDTFADINEATPNANPLQLDAAGRVPNCFGTGSFRVTLFTNDPILRQPDVQIASFDPVGGTTGVAEFDDWNAESIYSLTSIVQGSDGNYYSSLTTNNQGNDPISDPVNWEQIEFAAYWNTNKAYSTNDKVRLDDGTIFISLTDTNLGNNPLTNSDKWKSESIRIWNNAHDFGLNELIRDSAGALWRSLIADNTGNDPQTDDGTKWAYVSTPPSIAFTGGGTLLAYQINELQDGGTYTLPAADSVPSGAWVLVELPDEFSASQPTVQRDGTDTITDSGGTDTSFLFDAGSMAIRFVSDGISDWHI